MDAKLIRSRTFRLFNRPTFFSGIARLVDFGGVLNEYNTSPSAAEADARAIAADWQQVGRDLAQAMGQGVPDAETRK